MKYNPTIQRLFVNQARWSSSFSLPWNRSLNVLSMQRVSAPPGKPKLGLQRACSAFTLAEVLAALAFMAIVIPVAVEGLRVANLAGQVGQRKAAAMRVAERVLNETIVTGQVQGGAQNGTIQEAFQEYRWSMRTEPWPEDAMRLVTVQVVFPVQGREYDVQLSTLMDNSTP